MYPRVRQFESSELHRDLARQDLERARRVAGRPARRRGRWLAVAVVVAVIGAAAYAAAANAAPVAASCTTGPTTIGDSIARAFCGPATAAVRFGGKAFRFRNGECTAGPSFTVNLGTLVLGSTSSARPYFGFFVTNGRPGLYSGKQAAVSFASGPLHVSLAPTAASHVVLDRGLRSGSFSGRDLLGRRISGSFHC